MNSDVRLPRGIVRDKARDFMVALVESEVEMTFDNNDNDPTTFLDFVADVHTLLGRVLAGECDIDPDLRSLSCTEEN